MATSAVNRSPYPLLSGHAYANPGEKWDDVVTKDAKEEVDQQPERGRVHWNCQT